MTELIIKNTGNSRTLKTVANAKTLYPTYDKMLEAMINGTFPVDLDGLKAVGVQQNGTGWTKANVLKDATAALYGKTSSAVPDDIFAAIRPLITAASGDAISGTYTGNNEARRFIPLPFSPSAVLVLLSGRSIENSASGRNYYYGGLATKESPVITSNEKDVITVTEDGFNVYNLTYTVSSYYHYVNTNSEDVKYNYIAVR